jgi:hypothetical protein
VKKIVCIDKIRVQKFDESLLYYQLTRSSVRNQSSCHLEQLFAPFVRIEQGDIIVRIVTAIVIEILSSQIGRI